MTDVEVKELWVYASELWPSWKPQDRTVQAAAVQVWHDALGDYSQAEVSAALLALAMEPDQQFRPGLGTVRHQCEALRRQAGGMALPPAPDEAWAEVGQQVRRVGAMGLPSWSHPAVAEAVASMGWAQLCNSTNESTDRAHFLRLYVDVAARHVAPPTAPGVGRLLGVATPQLAAPVPTAVEQALARDTWPPLCPTCQGLWKVRSRTMGAAMGQPHHGECENGHRWTEGTTPPAVGS